MHDIDRTRYEADYGEYESDEFAYEFEDENYEDEYYEGEGEFYGNMYGESPFNEAEEMELAADLLTLQTNRNLINLLESFLAKQRRQSVNLSSRPSENSLAALSKVLQKARCQYSAA